MLALLGLLQARREWPGRDLRARLEISERTLRRDVEALRDLGYGVASVPGIGGHYRLGVGGSVPPLVLTADEAVAIAIGLRAGTIGAVTGLEEASAGALAKLEQSLSPATRDRIAAVEGAMVPLGPVDSGIRVDVVVGLARAIAESRRLRIDYTRHDGETVRREIEPHRIVHTPNRWYLVAWDVQREAWRTLRVDRLEPRPPIGPVFQPRDIPDDAVRDFTVHSIATAPYPLRARVRMLAPVEQVRKLFGPTIAETADAGDGTTILTAGTGSWDEFALYLGTAHIDFEVLEGDGLRDALRSAAERMLRGAS